MKNKFFTGELVHLANIVLAPKFAGSSKRRTIMYFYASYAVMVLIVFVIMITVALSLTLLLK